MHNMVNQKIIAKFALEKALFIKNLLTPYPPPKKIPSRRSRVLNLELQADINVANVMS